MELKFRQAVLNDAVHLFELRRKSILELAPTGMSAAQAQHWAANMTIERMEERIRETQLWIAEINGTIVGWTAIRGDYLDGLYVGPALAGRGIGSELLALAERLMRDRGVAVICLDASWNSEEFYLRRGYEPAGPPPANDARQFVKKLIGSQR